MTLGTTLRLGYLESSQARIPSIERSVLEKSAKDILQAARRESESASQANLPKRESRTPSPGGSTSVDGLTPSPAKSQLEWTHVPCRDIKVERNMRHQVSTSSTSNRSRSHNPHLVRTVRIEPDVPASKPPLVPGRTREQLVVTEQDLKRCGGNLKLLRECNRHRSESADRSNRRDLTLSFKSAYALRCQTEEADLRDPFINVENPEATRECSVNDLILNQVWFKALSPRRVTKDADRHNSSPKQPPASGRSEASDSTRASSCDVSADQFSRRTSRRSSSLRDRPTSTKSADIPSRARASSRRRAKTQGDLRPPRPEDEDAAKKKTPVKSRIQLIDDSVDSEGEADCGSIMVRNAARANKRFEQEIDGPKGPFFVWVSLDTETGEIDVYPKAIATRLEGAHQHGRSSVPLVGLGDHVDGTIVTLGDQPQQKTWRGEVRDVKRLVAPDFEIELAAKVCHHEGRWRFAHGDLEDVPSDRQVIQYWRSDYVVQQSPTLPAVNPDRRANCFINPGADWAA